MNEKMVVDAMKASISNFMCYTIKNKGKQNALYVVKYYVWLILLILLSPRHIVKSKHMVCAMTPLNKKQLMPYCDNDELFCFSRLNSKLSDIRKNLSVVSPYSLSKRISIIFHGVKFYFRNRSDLLGNMHFVLDYYAVANYLYDFSPDVIISPNTYERYCTLLSYLGHGLRIRLVGIQEGMIININPPAKVYCDEMHTFDQFEAEIFRELILNHDCNYVIDGFRSTISWTNYPANNKVVIAIASQDWLTETTLKIATELLSEFDNEDFEIIIYPHYREKLKQYKQIIKQYPSCKIITDVRHRNIDVLITFYSSIVLDFWSVNSQLPVICFHVPGYEPAYYRREGVTVCNSINEIIEKVKVFSS